MNFNVQVEIDWIENGNVDEELRAEVVHQVLSSVRKTTKKQVESIVYNRARNLVDGWILEQLHAFSDRPLRITDKWGDTVEHHESLTDMFKQQFDQFFDASVDKNGKTIDSCGYGGKLSRIDYLLNKLASDYLKNITDKMDRMVAREVNDAAQARIKEKIIKHTAEQVQKIANI